MSVSILCYIRGNCAFFTTQPLDQQWGDDWNDAPYEHNAGDPYTWREGYSSEPRYEIIRLYFEVNMETPADKAWGGYSAYSVEQINARHVAWLVPGSGAPKEAEPIFAGITLEQFKQTIWLCGGDTYSRDQYTVVIGGYQP